MPAHRVAVSLTRARGLPAVKLERWAVRMLESMELAGAELSIVLCDDAFIEDLNTRFAGEAHPTDVLAFASSEGPGPRAPGVLGDIVISLETARRQARERAASVDDEILTLLAHGLLHLLGYDHRFPAEERIMVAKTGRLVKEATAKRRPVARSRRGKV